MIAAVAAELVPHQTPPSPPAASLGRSRSVGERPAPPVVLELLETALRDQGARVLATRDSFEALETVRRLKVDLVLLSRAKTEVARDLRVFQPELSAVVLGDEPMWLAEIEAAVLAALAERGERA